MLFYPQIEPFEDNKVVVLNVKLPIQLGVLCKTQIIFKIYYIDFLVYKGNRRGFSVKNKVGNACCKMNNNLNSIM